MYLVGYIFENIVMWFFFFFPFWVHDLSPHSANDTHLPAGMLGMLQKEYVECAEFSAAGMQNRKQWESKLENQAC